MELFSVDIHYAYEKVCSALKKLAMILQSSLKTKREVCALIFILIIEYYLFCVFLFTAKCNRRVNFLLLFSQEDLRRVRSWQYVNCIELWVKFVTKNMREYNLQPFLNPVIQIVTGLANLFPGQRYFPLRLKCIQMLNELSSSSGVFIPVVSLLLDSLECSVCDNTEAGHGRTVDFSFLLKVPKLKFV